MDVTPSLTFTSGLAAGCTYLYLRRHFWEKEEINQVLRRSQKHLGRWASLTELETAARHYVQRTARLYGGLAIVLWTSILFQLIQGVY